MPSFSPLLNGVSFRSALRSMFAHALSLKFALSLPRLSEQPWSKRMTCLSCFYGGRQRKYSDSKLGVLELRSFTAEDILASLSPFTFLFPVYKPIGPEISFFHIRPVAQ